MMECYMIWYHKLSKFVWYNILWIKLLHQHLYCIVCIDLLVMVWMVWYGMITQISLSIRYCVAA